MMSAKTESAKNFAASGMPFSAQATTAAMIQLLQSTQKRKFVTAMLRDQSNQAEILPFLRTSHSQKGVANTAAAKAEITQAPRTTMVLQRLS
mmetsp:Transcript_83751/g.184031  ORF Transcript_83751/g.184031 Transcript_83751/m.184031 type:complete len:92 (+) Transcript_83751:1118-1393(+)